MRRCLWLIMCITWNICIFPGIMCIFPENFKEFYRFGSSTHEHDTRRCDNLAVDIENSVRSGFTLKYLGSSSM